MAFGHCKNCGTGLEKNVVCPNCDEAAFIMDWQSEYLENPSESFQNEAANGFKRASERLKEKGLKFWTKNPISKYHKGAIKWNY